MNRPIEGQPSFGLYDNFLGGDARAQLLLATLKRRDSFRPARVYHGVDQVVAADRRGSSRIPIPEDGPFGPLLSRIKSMTPEISAQLGIKPFPVRHYETEIVVHEDGACFKRHRDMVLQNSKHSRGGDRIVSCVYYFNAEPMKFSGGELRIFSLFHPDKCVVIDPEPDRLVVFPSFFFHEVAPIACPSGRFEDSRFSVNIWIQR